MSRRSKPLSLCLAIGIGSAIACFGTSVPAQAQEQARSGVDAKAEVVEKKAESDTKSPSDAKVRKTDEEWRKILTHNQFLVTRMKATEPPFTGAYSRGHYKGVFQCVCCKADLFDAKTKFESGTGWPSFWQPIRKDALTTQWDNSEAEARVEVVCRRCDAHLGHVFDDGPAPTGLRYCINSVAITLKKPAAKPGSEPAGKNGKKSARAKK